MADNTLLNSGAGGDTVRDIDRAGIKTQVVQLDAGGAAGESLVNLANPLPVAQSQTNFVFSAANSTTTQLAPAASFVGTIEAIINQTQLSILLVSDQNGTLTVNQYIDAAGTALASSYIFQITGGVGFSQALKGNGNYARLSFTNNGTVTTTTLNLNTYYGTILESVQVMGTFDQATGLPGALYSGDNASDNDLPTMGASGILGAEAYPRFFDGTYWQRVRGNIQGGLKVNVDYQNQVLTDILAELKSVTYYLQVGLNVKDDPEQVRSMFRENVTEITSN